MYCIFQRPCFDSLHLFIFLHYIASHRITLHRIFQSCSPYHNDRDWIKIIYVYTTLYYITYLISAWTSHSNKSLPGIRWPKRLQQICLQPQPQREDIHHQLALPHCPRATVMISLVHVVVGQDPLWLRSLRNCLQCGRRNCRGLYPRISLLACLT